MNIFNQDITGMKLVMGLFLLVILYPTIKLIIQLLMIQTEPSARVLLLFDTFFSERNLPWISSTIFLLFYFFLFTVQKLNKLKFINYSKFSLDLVGIYGFIIGLLSMYGIYIGFLQFIVGDSDKVRYLGKSKIKYLTDTSIWYQITQTKAFLVVLFLTIITPGLIINTDGEMHDSFIYAWQTSIMMLLWIYIFLIGMSLQIIRILFLIKGKTDLGLERIIRELIVSEYYRLFRELYRCNFDGEVEKRFFSTLKLDISRVDHPSIGFFLTKVFSEIGKEVGSKYGEYKSIRLERRSYGEYKKYLYDDYKRFVIYKWQVLSTVRDDIDWQNYKQLIDQDMLSFNHLVDETSKVYEENDDRVRLGHIKREEIDNIHNYLFEQLLEKAMLDSHRMETLYKDIQDNIRNIEFKEIQEKKASLLSYYTEIEQYKCRKIAEKYLHSENQFSLPKFNRYNNNECYSKSVFEYLIDYYNYLEEPILENKKLLKLVSSMNRKYQVAYYLYQIFYPDSGWNENTIFFQEKLKDSFQYFVEEEAKKIYTVAAKVVDEAHRGHRITLSILLTIYNDREKNIDSMTYFGQFEHSRISPLKIVFVQGILSFNNRYFTRITLTTQSIEQDASAIESLCMDFLHCIDRLPEISKSKGITYTMEYLLQNVPLNMTRLVNGLGIISLRYYRFILEYKKGISTIDLFLETVIHVDGDETSYHMWQESIFTFFALEIIDGRYEKYFSNKKFLDAFKLAGISLLNRLDMTIDEYTESIYEMLKNAPYEKLGIADLRQVTDKLEIILFK